MHTVRPRVEAGGWSSATPRPPAVLDEIAAAADTLLVSPDVVVVRQGEAATGMYVVRRGRLRLSRLTRDGQVRTLGFPGPAYVFGLVELVSGRPFTLDVRTESETSLDFYPRSKLMPLIFATPRVAVGLLVLLGEHTADLMQEMTEGLERVPPERRLTDALAEMAQLRGHSTSAGLVIEGLTVQELAERVGCSRQWATRQLKKLVDQRLIRHSRSRFVVSSQLLGPRR
jgi:CRP/FNR family transcriptional regulator